MTGLAVYALASLACAASRRIDVLYDGTPLPMGGMILFAALASRALYRLAQPRKSAPSNMRR